MPLGESINAISIFLEILLLQKLRSRGILSTFELIACWLDAHKSLFVFNEKQIYIYLYIYIYF